MSNPDRTLKLVTGTRSLERAPPSGSRRFQEVTEPLPATPARGTGESTDRTQPTRDEAASRSPQRHPTNGWSIVAAKAPVPPVGPIDPEISHDALYPGDLIDTYRVLRPLGTGGMSFVYLAEHVRTEHQVALKVLRGRTDDSSVERFNREAKALGSIRHPNVVAVQNAGVANGRVFLVTELLEGRTLRERLNNDGRVPLIEALELIAAAADGIAAAHAKKVMHRDVKPENLMLTDAGVVKVLDLGTAKFLTDDRVTARARTAGTAAYIAPERLQRGVVDPRCDIYSLGLVLYEAIAGVHPMLAKDFGFQELVVRQASYCPQQIPGIPPRTWHIIQRAIAKSPADRWTTMEEFARALRAEARANRSGEVRTAEDHPLARTNSGEWFGLRGRRLVFAGIGVALFPGFAALVLVGIAWRDIYRRPAAVAHVVSFDMQQQSVAPEPSASAPPNGSASVSLGAAAVPHAAPSALPRTVPTGGAIRTSPPVARPSSSAPTGAGRYGSDRQDGALF